MSVHATKVVEKVLGEIAPDNAPGVDLLTPGYLIRTVNRARSRLRPPRLRRHDPFSVPEGELMQVATNDANHAKQYDESFDMGDGIFIPTTESVNNLASNRTTGELTYYRILDGVSERGNRKLVDNRGYAYTQKRKLASGDVTWWCSVRNKNVSCRATVTQRGNQFRRGLHDHCHSPKPGLAACLAIKAKVINFSVVFPSSLLLNVQVSIGS